MGYEIQVKVDDHVGDIYKLECVIAVNKVPGGPFYALRYVKNHDTGELVNYAKVGDWLCKDDRGQWFLLDGKKHHMKITL